MKKFERVHIVYFSGTGGTKKAAECFEQSFHARGIKTLKYSVVHQNQEMVKENDFILLLFAVHAFNAPKAVYRWIDRLPVMNRVQGAVISVSGGGEISPNTACRRSCIKKLEKKGCLVSYEEMLVMPCNFATATPESVALRLVEVLPEKADFIVNELLLGVKRRKEPILADRILSRLAEAEKFGARIFGKSIRYEKNCNGCGWCSRNCPVGNIKIKNGHPVFGWDCHMCMGCLYGCPNKALTQKLLGFAVIKDGFSIPKLEQELSEGGRKGCERIEGDQLWAGVGEYLKHKS